MHVSRVLFTLHDIPHYLCFKALCAQTKAPCVENRGVVGIQADVKKPVENALVHQVKRHLVYIQS